MPEQITAQCIFDSHQHRTIIDRLEKSPMSKRMNMNAVFSDVELYLSLGLRDAFYDVSFDPSTVPVTRRYTFSKRITQKRLPRLYTLLRSGAWGITSNILANVLTEVISKKDLEPLLFDALRESVTKELVENAEKLVFSPTEKLDDTPSTEMEAVGNDEGLIVEEINAETYELEVARSERDSALLDNVNDTFDSFNVFE